MLKKLAAGFFLALLAASLLVTVTAEKAKAEVPTECTIAAGFGWHAGWANLACMLAIINDILDVYDVPGDGDTVG